jgi:hypothetical protein
MSGQFAHLVILTDTFQPAPTADLWRCIDHLADWSLSTEEVDEIHDRAATDLYAAAAIFAFSMEPT